MDPTRSQLRLWFASPSRSALAAFVTDGGRYAGCALRRRLLADCGLSGSLLCYRLRCRRAVQHCLCSRPSAVSSGEVLVDGVARDIHVCRVSARNIQLFENKQPFAAGSHPDHRGSAGQSSCQLRSAGLDRFVVDSTRFTTSNFFLEIFTSGYAPENGRHKVDQRSSIRFTTAVLFDTSEPMFAFRISSSVRRTAS